MGRSVKQGCVALLIAVLGAGPAKAVGAEPVDLANDHVRVRLDPDRGYAFSGLAHAGQGVDFIQPVAAGEPADRSPWLIRVRDANGTVSELTASNARSASHDLADDRLTVRWLGVGSEACPSDLTVTVTGRLPEGSPKSYWRMDIEGAAPGVVWQVDFPRVFDIRAPGEDQACFPHYSGRLWRDPTRHGQRVVLSYPMPASMQFCAYWAVPAPREPELPEIEGYATETGWSPDCSDAAGLYWAAEDGALYYKRLALDTQVSPGRLCWWIEHLPELDEWPIRETEEPRPVRYSLPYDVAIGAFTGDYHEAAELYLDWAKAQDWCARGAADVWPPEQPEPGSEDLARWVPLWFREIGFWAKFYHEPAKVLPEWAAYRKWLGVPMASHYYRYSVNAFDDNYPEHLPPDPYFIDGIRDARDLGVRPLPYINGVIWDTDTQSWFRENGFAAAIKNEVGEIYPWDISGELYAYMDPASEQWRAKMRETAGKLIVEHGCSGVYLDCLTATASRPSYDPTHPHPCHGGSWHGQGNRKLMHDLRAEIRRFDPEACFFSEQIGELVIDLMDGFLTLDQMRSAPQAGMQVYPIFTAVYHPYAINFGCDAHLGQEPELFAWEMGQMLVWGAQPLNSVIVAPIPQPGDANAEFLREVCQAYYVAGQRFLQGGRWRRIAVRPPDGKPAQCGLELVSQPDSVRYEQRRDQWRVWHGPAVMASAWEREGDIAVVLANITNEEQTVDLAVQSDKLGLPPEAELVRIWPRPAEPIGQVDGSHRLTVPARKVALYVMTTDVARASVGREVDETPWELVSVVEGELPPVEGPAGSLWACSDGPVLNAAGADKTVATAQWLTEEGEFERRNGHQAQLRGPQAEGCGLPRDLADKPFALLRRLPHRLSASGSEAVVLSGDDHHLLCLVRGGGRIEFAHPGITVATEVESGERLAPLEAPENEALDLPDGGDYLVGYATLAVGENFQHLGPLNREASALRDALFERLGQLREGTPGRRDAILAEVTATLVLLECSLGDAPGLLCPGGPLMSVHQQVQALARAQVGCHWTAAVEHCWLTPGLAKAVRGALVAMDGSEPRDRLLVDLVPVGSWGEGGCSAMPDGGPEALDGRGRVYYWELLLSDPQYVERMVPVVAAVEVEADGLTYQLADVAHLEANRPFEIRKHKSVLTVVGGQTGRSSVVLRNWSPDNVRATISLSGPDGWRLTSEPVRARLPAPADSQIDILVQPPATERRGSYEVECFANHLADPSAAVKAIIRVALLPSLAPLASGAAPEPPGPPDQARLRRSGKLVIYAREGEPLRLSMHNYRAGNYTATATFSLRGPDLETLDAGTIPLNESHEIDLKAPGTGTYHLEVLPGVGQAEVQTESRFVAELATDQDKLHLFCSPVTRWFHVPAGARSFELCAQDGGPDETARFVVTSPAGRVALDRDGNYAGTEMEVEVRPEEAGKVWRLRVEPRQDISLWLKGDVCPYLSATADGVLVEEGAR